jgi:hypothetical protein
MQSNTKPRENFGKGTRFGKLVGLRRLRRSVKLPGFGILSVEQIPIYRVLCGTGLVRKFQPHFEVAVHSLPPSHMRGWLYRDLREKSVGLTYSP